MVYKDKKWCGAYKIFHNPLLK